jgi:hypothetical protein
VQFASLLSDCVSCRASLKPNSVAHTAAFTRERNSRFFGKVLEQARALDPFDAAPVREVGKIHDSAR